MNRSARCIQMLQLLKSRGFLTREQIAEELGTNVRNIAEYRKELEHAGYIIASTTGKYGGYELLNACLLPPVRFSEDETRALQELQTYISSRTDFLLHKEVKHALNKVLSTTTSSHDQQFGFYLDNEQYILSDTIKEMIQKVEEARHKKHVVEIVYRTLKEKQAQVIHIHPYEIINYKGAYYCLAYSLKAKDFRNYKFSEERMKKVTVLDNSFVRALDFDMKKHIGKSGLIKGEIMEVTLQIYGDAALLVAEKHIGMHPSYTWIKDDVLLFTTYFESLLEAKSFVLSLGSNAEVIQPKNLREHIQEEVKNILLRYNPEVKS